MARSGRHLIVKIDVKVGVAISILFLVLGYNEHDSWFTQVHFLHRTFYLFILCGLVNYVVSLYTTPPTAEQVEHYTWRPEIIKEDSLTPWYKNYRVQSVILIIITILLVG